MHQKQVKTISHSDRYAEVEIEKVRIKAQLLKTLGIDPKDEPILRLVLNDILKGF